MRIISGSRRGHKLLEFDGMDIRPTTDRVRESLFNLICDWVRDAVVLDLFGGCGTLSFEALSRGAKSAVIVDIEKRSTDIIKENAKKLNFLDRTDILTKSAKEYLLGCLKSFDLIFLDPPYNKGLIAPVIGEIVEKGILKDGGILVLESDNTDEHGEFFGLSILKQRRYGRTYITVYQRGEGN